eukprot:TRINITY_DN6376_c0_g2_i1.p1 TRINITY_DN6376_c0_g2~~TRINITY_DN6376_c0_g2_i1.p1  ORF type:complete len:642 (+),score=120.19 TRINITY_DN6376_c0_g2_i1:138-2063(+)
MASSHGKPTMSQQRPCMHISCGDSDTSPTSTVLFWLLEASSNRAQNLQGFLDEVERAGRAVDIVATDRSYRSSFTENYKTMFDSHQRWYAADVLRASLNLQEQITVSGVTYDISDLTCQKATDLEQRYAELTDFLDSCAKSSMTSSKPQLKPLLLLFDTAFVYFEKHYITELIEIEIQARSPVVLASDLEMDLQALEKRCPPCKGEKLARSAAVKVPGVSSAAGLLQLPEPESPRTRRRQPSSPRFGLWQFSGAESPTARRRQPSSPRFGLRQFSGAESPCSRQHHSFGEGSPCARQREESAELPEIIATASEPSEQSSWPGTPCQSHIHRLAVSASSRCKRSSVRAALEKLLAQVSTLNSCINVHGRGREDMTIEVLEAAADAFLTKAMDAEGSGNRRSIRASEAARRYLASNVLASFADLRIYFAEAGKDIMHIDPELGNNTALVQRLAAWEESWELGAQFLVNSDMLESLCNVAAQAADAQRYAPELESLLQDQDAEVFLILPRLVLLCGLAVPAYSALTHSFLPHHFAHVDGSKHRAGGGFRQSADENMTDLMSAFEHVNAVLGRCDTWHKEVFIRRAILGASQGSHLNDTDKEVDRFMLQLEGFSMELQRHHPGDWNRCCSILMRCIAAASEPTSC